jgi:hypothetical protein
MAGSLHYIRFTYPISKVCNGDSGGPLIWQDQNDGNRSYIAGIASFMAKKTCDYDAYPFVFARVTTALDWVLKETGEEVFKCLPPIRNTLHDYYSIWFNFTAISQYWAAIVGRHGRCLPHFSEMVHPPSTLPPLRFTFIGLARSTV